MDVQLLNASELLARTESKTCTGWHKCHWCGNPCGEDWLHDDLPIIPFVKSKAQARCPAEHWICYGCMMFHRKRVTVKFLDGTFKDGRCPLDYSWLIADEARAVREEDKQQLLEVLRKPPRLFALTLRNGSPGPTLIHVVPVNNSLFEVLADTRLQFTFGNRMVSYTIYELNEALEHGAVGREPGVRALVGFITPEKLDFAAEPPPQIDRPKRGVSVPRESKARADHGPKAIIRASGV